MNTTDWAMNGTNWDDMPFIPFPLLLQPKLNGVRARWDGHQLLSRQCKVFNETALPGLHKELRFWSACNPGVILDGELYGHGLRLQDITARVAINRVNAHPDIGDIGYHAFDIISELPAQTRLAKLAEIYTPKFCVPWVIVRSEAEVNQYLNFYTEFGYEGIMLRAMGCPYMPGRSEALIKLKPWRYAKVPITGFSPGRDKYQGILGALVCKVNTKEFKVSGGLTDAQRSEIWLHQSRHLGEYITVRFRELSRDGRPLQPQIYQW